MPDERRAEKKKERVMVSCLSKVHYSLCDIGRENHGRRKGDIKEGSKDKELIQEAARESIISHEIELEASRRKDSRRDRSKSIWKIAGK